MTFFHTGSNRKKKILIAVTLLLSAFAVSGAIFSIMIVNHSEDWLRLTLEPKSTFSALVSVEVDESTLKPDDPCHSAATAQASSKEVVEVAELDKILFNYAMTRDEMAGLPPLNPLFKTIHVTEAMKVYRRMCEMQTHDMVKEALQFWLDHKFREFFFSFCNQKMLHVAVNLC